MKWMSGCTKQKFATEPYTGLNGRVPRRELAHGAVGGPPLRREGVVDVPRHEPELRVLGLGFGRIVVSEIEVPILSVNLV